MLAAVGLSPRRAWEFELYGGTVLLAAGRDGDPGAPTADDPSADDSVASLLARDAEAGVCDPGALAGLQRDTTAKARGLRDWLVAERATGRTVLGYGAASRAVALLRWAEVDQTMISAVADASPAKRGLRMPGTDIGVVSPDVLAAHPGASVVLFVPDLLPEVRAAYPGVEAAGGRWVDAEALASARA
jgi:hypothetical protein